MVLFGSGDWRWGDKRCFRGPCELESCDEKGFMTKVADMDREEGSMVVLWQRWLGEWLATYHLLYIRLPRTPNQHTFTLKMATATFAKTPTFDAAHPLKSKSHTELQPQKHKDNNSWTLFKICEGDFWISETHSNSTKINCHPSKIQPLVSSSWRGVTSLDGEQGSSPPKPRCEVYWRLHGTRVVIAVSLTIPSRHQAAPCHINDFHPYGALWVVNLVPWFSWKENGTGE
jgi:hypothetical protein